MSLLLFIVPHKATGIPHWKGQKIPFQIKDIFRSQETHNILQQKETSHILGIIIMI